METVLCCKGAYIISMHLYICIFVIIAIRLWFDLSRGQTAWVCADLLIFVK